MKQVFLLSIGLLAFLVVGGSKADGQKAKERNRIQPVPIGGLSPEPVTMDTVNHRWRGARCQIRFSVEIGKGSDKGWSRSDWLYAPALPGEKPVKIRFSVSNREGLVRGGYLRRNKEIRPGTPFVVTGWHFVEPHKQKGFIVNLRFESLPVDARVEFKDFDRIEHLEDLEQLMRIELFQLHEGSQVAVEAAGEAGTSSGQPNIKIVSATAQPAVVRRGSELELLISYELHGVDLGSGLEIAETRELISGDDRLAVFNATRSRKPGLYTSSHKIQVTESTKPGRYTYRAEIRLNGTVSEASSVFEVK